ncbi:hypothetical protein D3C87_1815540 [compost metagenome]
MTTRPSLSLPLPQEALGRDNDGFMQWVLHSQSIDDHQCLNRFAQANLISHKMPDPGIRKDTSNGADLVRIWIGRDAQRTIYSPSIGFGATTERLHPRHEQKIWINRWHGEL